MANYPRVTHPFAAKHSEYCYPKCLARLACLIHAASVRSEPESNSPYKNVSLNCVEPVKVQLLVLLIIKTLQNQRTNSLIMKGLFTYRTIQFSMSSGCFHPKFSKAFFHFSPVLGDKKPESRFSFLNSALRAFLISCESTYFVRSDCQNSFSEFLSVFRFLFRSGG